MSSIPSGEIMYDRDGTRIRNNRDESGKRKRWKNKKQMRADNFWSSL